MGYWWYGDGLTESSNAHSHNSFGAMTLFDLVIVQFTQ